MGFTANPRKVVRRSLSANRSGSDRLNCPRKTLELSRSLPLRFADRDLRTTFLGLAVSAFFILFVFFG